MARLWKRRRGTSPGTAPGTLVGDPSAVAPRTRLFAYDKADAGEVQEPSLDAVRAALEGDKFVWLDVDGLRDTSLIEAIGQMFDLHRLALEDVVNVHQRPKVEDYDEHVFIVLHMPATDGGSETEQMAMFLGDGFLVTFQERPGDFFEAVRDRLRRGKGRLRTSGVDYLAYALIDAAVDAYFPILERHGDRLEELEDDVVADATPALVGQLHGLKRELLALRRSIWPHRELLSALIRDESPCFEPQTRIYLRDCYDHTIQLMDILETYREIASGLVDVYLSSMSAKLNEIMKVLTVISTIFMPLGFIASLYGMNFDRTASPYNMPELGWYLGYPMALALMTGGAGGLLWWFRRRGWLGTKEGDH